MSKLLTVGITDVDIYVRYSVLSSLDERFDLHLAQAENLNALFICLNDEVFEIRELGLCTIGRLSGRNPAYVMPSLRKVSHLFSSDFQKLNLFLSLGFTAIVDRIGILRHLSQ